MAGAPEWTLVAAGHQTGGRGRLGRTWIDVPGRALLFSIVLRPTSLPADRARLADARSPGVAMAERGRDVTGRRRCVQVAERPAASTTARWRGILAESRVDDGDRIDYVDRRGRGEPGPAGERGAGRRARRRRSRRAAADGVPAIVRGRPTARTRRRSSERSWRAYPRESATIGREVEATTTDGRRVRGTRDRRGRRGEPRRGHADGRARVDVRRGRPHLR